MLDVSVSVSISPYAYTFTFNKKNGKFLIRVSVTPGAKNVDYLRKKRKTLKKEKHCLASISKSNLQALTVNLCSSTIQKVIFLF